jgi:1,2-dihydroxy-3-keto-5-methylthiopentene dioxygenase
MSRLRIFDETQSQTPLAVHHEHAAIAHELGKVGVRFEQWEASQPIAPGASQDEVIAAYRGDIDRLMDEKGYQAVDVISLAPDHPERATLRQKFLSEHTHSEDEVRFFVSGAGNFILHTGGKIYDVHCTQGDLISVPANTKHWFDAGLAPNFTALRVFTDTSGWVPHYTGEGISESFPAS